MQASSQLRVALIPASFDPRLNYQENVVAPVLHGLGHDVRVFAALPHGTSPDGGWEALDASLPYPVVRARRVLRWKSTVLPLDSRVVSLLRDFRPQVAILLAPNHGLGACWMRCLPADCRIIAGFSDLPWHRNFLREWIKARWARKVIARADLIITATGESGEMVRRWGGQEAMARTEQIGLLIDTAGLEGGEAPKPVQDLAHRVPRIISCITRVTPDKDLGSLFRAVEQVLLAEPDAGFVMAGLDEGEESLRLRRQIESSAVASRCVVLPRLTGKEVCAVFRLSSISLWSLVSVGIYHSLFSGCPVLVREGQDARHLVDGERTGWWFPSFAGLEGALVTALSSPPDRIATRRAVAGFDAAMVLSRLLNEVLSGRSRE